MKNKAVSLFVNEAIRPDFIANSIAKHSTKTQIGAHQIFLGQIRAEEKKGNNLLGIEFSSYQEMALNIYTKEREAIFEKFPITCMHVYHSLGYVAVGEMNLFVFVSSPHRAAAIDACAQLVEFIKFKLPIWGKECWENESHSWKENTLIETQKNLPNNK